MNELERDRAQRTSAFPRRARWILTSFLFTFMAARITVFLIASRRIRHLSPFRRYSRPPPELRDLPAFRSGCLSSVSKPAGKGTEVGDRTYGIGLALTFDEFGMWLHLGGSYWQRASFDAVVVIAGFLGLIVVAPHFSRFRPNHWFTAVALALAVVIFGIMLVDSFRYAHRILFRIETLEEALPPR